MLCNFLSVTLFSALTLKSSMKTYDYFQIFYEEGVNCMYRLFFSQIELTLLGLLHVSSSYFMATNICAQLRQPE